MPKSKKQPAISAKTANPKQKSVKSKNQAKPKPKLLCSLDEPSFAVEDFWGKSWELDCRSEELDEDI